MPKGRSTAATKKAIEESESPVLHYNLPLIEVSEGWILDTLLRDASAGRMIVARIDQCTALIVPGQADSLIARLRKLGHTPRILHE